MNICILCLSFNKRIMCTCQHTFWPTSPAPLPHTSSPFWAEAPASFPRSRCILWCRRPAKDQLQKQRRTNVNCFHMIKRLSCSRRWYLCCIFYSHGGISAILGTRNFSLRCLSSSCLSRYAATSAEVGLQPSEAETRLKVSAGFEPSNGSIAARLGGCRPAERTRHATFF